VTQLGVTQQGAIKGRRRMMRAVIRGVRQCIVKRTVRHWQMQGSPIGQAGDKLRMIYVAAASLLASVRREMPFVLLVRNIQAMIERIEELAGFILGDDQRRREK
jgi:hypothetical protein